VESTEGTGTANMQSSSGQSRYSAHTNKPNLFVELMITELAHPEDFRGWTWADSNRKLGFYSSYSDQKWQRLI